jgi:hypothetical protein
MSEADPRRRGEGEDRDRREGRAEGGHAPGRSRRQTARQRQQRIADDAAESGRQRPAARRGKERGQGGRRRDPDKIEPDLDSRAGKPSFRQEPPTPEGRRRQRRDAGQPEHLHDDIGGDRARTAEEIVDRRVGCVIEARVLDRPGQERESHADDPGERGDPERFGRPALRKLPHRGRQVVEHRECRRTHRSPARSARRVSRAPLVPDPKQAKLMHT